MQGADPSVVRRAIDEREPLPGTGGFAGELDGALVRDVLGRYPLFSDVDDPSRWSEDPTELDTHEPVPAGYARRIKPGVLDDQGVDDDVLDAESIEASGLEAEGHDDHTAGPDTRVWSLPDPDVYEADTSAVDAVHEAVTRSVDAVGQSDGGDEAPPAIAFSGGVDSSILAARLDGPLYVGGFEGSHDVEAARAAASALGREDALHVVEFTHADLERVVPEIVRATGRRNPMDVQIAIPLSLVAERAACHGHDRLAVGQGADELFGGYAKVADAEDHPRVDAETVRGTTREVIASLPAQLERDALVLRAAGVEPVRPLLHDRVVSAALRLPSRLLVDDGVRKVALRRAADFLPDPVRTRDKKAVQYGSLVAREFDRLARRAGFKRQMDDHLGQFIDSLVD